MINSYGVKSEKYFLSLGMAKFGFTIQNASKKSITRKRFQVIDNLMENYVITRLNDWWPHF